MINLVLLMEGGIVQQIITDQELEGLNLKVLIADFDTEGMEEKELSLVDGDEAYVYEENIFENKEFTKDVLKALEKKQEEQHENRSIHNR
jgi:soluble P-type ATPase